MRLIDADAISYESIDTSDTGRHEHYYGTGIIAVRKEDIDAMPAICTDKNKISDLLYHIYSIQSPHLDVTGVVAKKYYCQELWKELFGKESELPIWMKR